MLQVVNYWFWKASCTRQVVLVGPPCHHLADLSNRPTTSHSHGGSEEMTRLARSVSTAECMRLVVVILGVFQQFERIVSKQPRFIFLCLCDSAMVTNHTRYWLLAYLTYL